VHCYYHSVPLVCCLWVIYLTQYITLAPHSSSALLTFVCFLVFHRLTGKHLALLRDVVSRFESFSKVPCLAQEYGTHRSDSPIRDL
jgi:hypothetical protein